MLRVVIFVVLFFGQVSSFALKVDESELNSLVKAYQSGMPKRIGKSEEVWEKFVAGTIEHQNSAALKILLKFNPAPGEQLERYRVELKNILLKRPIFTIKTALKLFGRHSCLIYKVLPENKQIKYQEVRPTLNRILKKKQVKEVSTFRKQADKYFKSLKAGKPQLNLLGCFKH